MGVYKGLSTVSVVGFTGICLAALDIAGYGFLELFASL